MTSLFGPIVSLVDVEEAVLETLRVWLPEYLAEVERQHELPVESLERPPAPDSYHGNTGEIVAWSQDKLPEVIVVVEPVGEPERTASAGYGQEYEVLVGCVCRGEDGVTLGATTYEAEDAARLQASHYGAAVQLLVQKAPEIDLAGAESEVEWVVMSGAPKVDCPEPDVRSTALALTTFRLWVRPIVNEFEGPVGEKPEEAPGYKGAEEPWGEPPTVTSEKLTVDIEKL